MKLIEIIGSKIAISPIKGKIAYDFIIKELEKENKVIISFEGVSDCTSAFCNSFIGKLYMNLNPDTLDKQLILKDIHNEIWNSKIQSSKLLGRDENVRESRKASINNLVLI